jgi:hypothetical protein
VTDVVIQLDMFPASALLAESGTTFMNTRVAVVDGNVEVWRNEYPAPVVVFTAPLTSFEGNVRVGYTLHTDAGTVIAGKDGGCGCGATLGTADLWPGLRRINTSL